jgi:hypothetical protein
VSLSQELRINPKAKRVYLHRFILCKFVFFREELDLRDLCLLFENQLWLEKKCQSDPEFLTKFGKPLEGLSDLMKKFNLKTGTTDRAIDRFANKVKINLPELVLPKRNYKQAFSKCNGLFTLQDSKRLGKPKNTVPQPVRLGKGYRDKGSARDLAKDGSPSWQEVATHRGPIYHKGKRINVSIDSQAETIADSIVDSIDKSK